VSILTVKVAVLPPVDTCVPKIVILKQSPAAMAFAAITKGFVIYVEVVFIADVAVIVEVDG